MEHGKHARHRRRIQRRPHLIVSLLVSSPVSLLLVPFYHPAIPIPSRPHRILVPSGDTKGGAVFSSARLVCRARIPLRRAPFHQAHSFRRSAHSVLPLVSPDVSPSVISSVVLPITGAGMRYGNKWRGFLFNAIFFHLTFQMLNTKKQC